jgi:hypothetical protein
MSAELREGEGREREIENYRSDVISETDEIR